MHQISMPGSEARVPEEDSTPSEPLSLADRRKSLGDIKLSPKKWARKYSHVKELLSVQKYLGNILKTFSIIYIKPERRKKKEQI